ncbi:hypothetical protein E4634_06815 [Mangrovimicrobium sediminis]|uniref:Uncharacterized protein n=1 Tax=Mangrovimicrobium sediminis TaxID=2562682 RepID=A0A4Z0M664_9GAMM|nr:AAA family ATPase [Haliea sp. SAOS-164]TGD74897.1 hypothetical protein E4634_06815 [Haliea sp. SAOS-164]
MTGNLIVVTGTTGSGKTTTCREFIDRHDDPWLHFGADNALGTLMSRKFVDGGARCDEGVCIEPADADDPDSPYELKLGAVGMPVIHAMHRMIAAALDFGMNIITDHVTTMNPPILEDCVRVLHGYPVLFVALKPPPEILDARIDGRLEDVARVVGMEQAKVTNERTRRGSQSIGREIYSHDCFDLVLDTGKLSPAEVAQAIAQRQRMGPGEGFGRLAGRFGVAG